MKKNKNKGADKIVQAGIYPSDREAHGHAPVTDDIHVKEARDWVNHNKK
ncbi:MAG: hypothetical protein LBL09_01220 [Oscillospiraceae bacterium]|jgi:hypothetical protein|nr:hypothetical protein [Oscillospiraceae bacterium]